MTLRASTDETRRRILITGAGGFVCSNIVAALLDAGWHVYALDRAFDADYLSWFPQFSAHSAHLNLIRADADKLPDVAVEALIHGAALTADAKEIGLTPEGHLRANLEPLFAATAWARASNIRRALFISSAAVIRKQPVTPGKSLPVVSEQSYIDPTSLYAVAKATLEYFIAVIGQESDGDRQFAALRFSNIYGPGERIRPTRPRMSLPGQYAMAALDERRIRVPSNAQAGDWTFAPDIGRAVCALLDAPTLRYPLYQVTSGQMYTPAEIVRQIQTIVQRVAIDRFEDSGVQTARGPLTHAPLIEDTGFGDWTGLAEGLQQTVAWFERQAQKQAESAGRS